MDDFYEGRWGVDFVNEEKSTFQIFYSSIAQRKEKKEF